MVLQLKLQNGYRNVVHLPKPVDNKNLRDQTDTEAVKERGNNFGCPLKRYPSPTLSSVVFQIKTNEFV